jgi:hypothetical protein
VRCRFAGGLRRRAVRVRVRGGEGVGEDQVVVVGGGGGGGVRGPSRNPKNDCA